MSYPASLFSALLFSAGSIFSGNMLTLEDIAGGKFSAETLSAVTPLAGGESYAQISDDGTKIQKFSYKTGRQTAVLLDVNNTVGDKIDKVDGYIMSPDGTRMLVQTKTKRIYRRSFTAVYYIYNIADRKMQRLSDYGPQQAPVWSPDGQMVAFVRDNNIYLVKLLYGNAESQVTTDGKRNEIINGVPDWVNEEEFATNRSMTFNADGTMLCWLKYDETKVPTYSLQMYKGLKPEKTDNTEYPGIYSYKYPKAGQLNSKVSVYSFDIQSRRTRQMQVPVGDEDYVPRIKATTDAQQIVVCVMNRHQLQIIRGTELERMYRREPFRLYSADEYIALLSRYIQLLRPDMVLERFTSQSPKDLLVAPDWGLKNYEFTNLLVNFMRRNNMYQGQLHNL